MPSVRCATPDAMKRLPETPGVYFMRGVRGELLYIGKAANLRRRVSSYFSRPLETRLARLVREVRGVAWQETDTVIEALVLEAELIKKRQPPYNIREKDDTSFLYIGVTSDPFPRILLARGAEIERADGARRFRRVFGPFTSAGSAKEAYRIVRKIFPFNTHAPEIIGRRLRRCLDSEIGLCPGACAGAIDRRTYAKTVRNVIRFMEGRKNQVARGLESEMTLLGKKQMFEEAEKVRRQISALAHIEDVALITEDRLRDVSAPPDIRIEGYDISNISGTSAVGVMVVMEGGAIRTGEYRKFRIRRVAGQNDTAMIAEVLERRLRHAAWRLPNLVLVDGGLGQMGAARRAIRARGLELPVVGIAKGPLRKNNRLIGALPRGASRLELIRLRDEAHRFAVAYHRSLRSRLALRNGGRS